jgi:hypothetical protein
MLRWPDGECYNGGWWDGQRHGEGHYVWGGEGERGKCKNEYKGSWKYGKRHGYGVFTKLNGDVYEGNFGENAYDGDGVLRKANGDCFDGKFVKGGFLRGKARETQDVGVGVGSGVRDPVVFTGNYVKGRKAGTGLEKHLKTGKVFKVEWRHGLKYANGEELCCKKCVIF